MVCKLHSIKSMNKENKFSRYSPEKILENLSTAVLIFDDQLKLSYINPAGEGLFAHSASHAKNRSLHELIHNSETMAEQLTAAMETGQSFTQRGCQLELPVLGKICVNCTVTPVINGTTTSGAMMELRQIDHHMRIEQEEHLIAQQEATRELLRGLAHEIKNPLGGLRGSAQLLERELTDASLKEYTQIIIDEADRLQNLIDRMLGPNNVPRMQPTNIHEALEHVRELVQAEAGTTLQIKQDYDPSLPELEADAELLVQALLNIVRNAAQALGNKGTIVLRTRVLRKKNIGSKIYRLVASIEVEDNGPGIDERVRDTIFYPMITTRSEGTGLGLSIAQSLINKHGGLVECSSQPGKTVFTVLLPMEKTP